MLTGFDKYRATMNAFLAKFTYSLLSGDQQNQIHHHTLSLMKRCGFIKDDFPNLTELEMFSFYALGMSELGIAPALANEAWSVIDNPVIALKNPEYKVSVVKNYFNKTHGIQIDMDWESSRYVDEENLMTAAEKYFKQGFVSMKSGNYQQAINDFNKAIEIYPKLVDAYVNRGSVYFKLGNYQQSMIDYNKAIELNPEYTEAYQNRGSAANELGNSNMAIQNYKMAAQLGDTNVQQHLSSQGIKWR